MENNNELSKGTKIKIIVITALVIITTIIGVSYAFFSVGVTGNEEASSIEVTAALLRLTYTDNLSLGGSEIYPGWSQVKTITVENTGTDTVNYKIIWRELLNQITNDELTISAICTSNIDKCNGIVETPINTYLTQVSNQTIKDRISIDPNETHTYTVKVTFKELGSAQNYNQGKTFYGTLNIAEGLKPVKPVLTSNTYEGMRIVTIGEEEFYDITNVVNYSSFDSSFKELIDYDASKSVLLARYNLSPTTGMQTTSTTQSDYAVAFSKEVYWDSGSGITAKYGTYDNDENNIYDTNYQDASGASYSVAYYLENYVSSLGVKGTGRLLTILEANLMTTNQRTNNQYYYLGSASGNFGVQKVNSNGSFGANYVEFANNTGVRPILIVNTSDIQTS